MVLLTKMKIIKKIRKLKIKKYFIKYRYYILVGVGLFLAVGFFWFQQWRMVRQPVFAGKFYSPQKEALQQSIDQYLEEAEDIEIEGKLRILIVPHASHNYSGEVAAYGFKKLKGENFKTVILIGPSHNDRFEGISIWPKGYWVTPLGKIQVDSNLAKRLIDEDRIFFRRSAFAKEHSLEVELPFLQRVLKEFKIVPIVMGISRKENIQALSSALAKNIDEDTLVVISSDLSHYPPYKVAVEADKITIEAILSGDVGRMENLEKVVSDSMPPESLCNLRTLLCGEDPVKTALMLAKELDINKIKLLKYANSGDTREEYLEVVGYAAIAFSAP